MVNRRKVHCKDTDTIRNIPEQDDSTAAADPAACSASDATAHSSDPPPPDLPIVSVSIDNGEDKGEKPNNGTTPTFSDILSTWFADEKLTSHQSWSSSKERKNYGYDTDFHRQEPNNNLPKWRPRAEYICYPTFTTTEPHPVVLDPNRKTILRSGIVHKSAVIQPAHVVLQPDSDEDLVKSLLAVEKGERKPDQEKKPLSMWYKCLKCACKKKTKVFPISDYVIELDPAVRERLVPELDIVRDYYQGLKTTLKGILTSKEKDMKKQSEIKLKLYDIFSHYENAVTLIHRVHLSCGASIRQLSYYFDSELTPEQVKHVDGRSVIGSYLWIIVLCMQSLHGFVEKDQEDFDEIKRTLEDVVGQSFVIWRGITHLVQAFIDCRRKTESVLSKYLEIWDSERNIRLYEFENEEETLAGMSTQDRAKALAEKKKVMKEEEQRLQHERAERLKKLFVHNKIGDNELITREIPPGPLPSSPEVTVVRANIEDGIWVPFNEIRTVDRFLTVSNLGKLLVQILEEVHGHLRSIDRHIHLFSWGGEEHESDMSYLQSIYALEKSLKKIKSIHPSKLDLQDREALARISKILRDELDLTEFLMMILRTIAHETRHVVHVAYEYARLFYPKSLLQYEFICPPDAKRCLQKLHWQAYFEDFEFSKIDFRSAIFQFTTSPHIQLLHVLPIRDRRHMLKLQPLSEDPRKQRNSILSLLKNRKTSPAKPTTTTAAPHPPAVTVKPK